MVVFAAHPAPDAVTMAAEHGVLVLEIETLSQGEVARWLGLKKRGKLKIEMKEWRKDRTLPQNALFHAIVGEISAETGMDFELVKAALKEQYCPKLAMPLANGDVALVPKPTHLLDTREMGRVIDGALAEAAFLGIDTQPFLAERRAMGDR